MPAAVRNVSYLPLLCARVLKSRGREEHGCYRSPLPILVNVERPLERMPAPAGVDPLAALLRAVRVIHDGVWPPKERDPDFHVPYSSLRDAATKAEKATPSR